MGACISHCGSAGKLYPSFLMSHFSFLNRTSHSAPWNMTLYYNPLFSCSPAGSMTNREEPEHSASKYHCRKKIFPPALGFFPNAEFLNEDSQVAKDFLLSKILLLILNCF